MADPEQIQENINRIVRWLLVATSTTQADLAAAIGVTEPTLSRLLSGSSRAWAAWEVYAIALHFAAPIDVFLRGDLQRVAGAIAELELRVGARRGGRPHD